jgi:hypothetical protein
MVVSLPRRGGGRGGHGLGRGGPPFRDRERNPRLVSNWSNTTLAASVSRLPPAPGQPAIVTAALARSPAPPAVARRIWMTLLPRRSALNQIHFCLERNVMGVLL